jgi:hypothetical protein
MDIRLQRDDAIEMAIRSGDLLYQQDDDKHDWALMLIISNLFELVADVEEPRARFEHGFRMIMGEILEQELPFGWHPRWVAEAIRNMLDHGLDLDRKQTKNDRDDNKAKVKSMGFIPHDALTRQSQVLFDIYEVGDEKYILLVSPMLYWRYVQEWYERRSG